MIFTSSNSTPVTGLVGDGPTGNRRWCRFRDASAKDPTEPMASADGVPWGVLPGFGSGKNLVKVNKMDFSQPKSEGWTDVFCWLESNTRMNHEFGLSPRCSYVSFFFFELFLRMMLLAVILGVVGVSLGLLPASWNLKLAKVFVSWGIRWDFCSGYWDYWYVKTMHTSVSPIDTNTDGPWNMYLRLQNISSFWVCSTSGGVRTTDKNLAKIEVMSWDSPLDLDPQTPQGQAANSSCPFRWGPRDAGGVMEWSMGHRLDASSFGVKM